MRIDYFLPSILAFITGKPRYKVDIEWSKNSFVHNAFRVYEMLFWRRQGIRVEMATYSRNGRTIYRCFTFESVCALLETRIREMLAGLKRERVWVRLPVLQGSNGFTMPVFGSNVLFAIAYDTVSTGNAGAGTSNTFSHTCTGSDLTLTVGSIAQVNPAPSQTATYNSVGMTACVNSSEISTVNNTIFCLASPATGANNVAISAGALCHMFAHGISLSGTSGTPAGGTATGSSTDTNATVTVTTVSNNSVIVDSVYVNGAVETYTPAETGSGQTSRAETTSVSSGTGLASSTMTTTTAGNYSPAWTLASSVLWGHAALEIKEAITTNVKTFNGLAKASVKSAVGLAIASVKSKLGLQ